MGEGTATGRCTHCEEGPPFLSLSGKHSKTCPEATLTYLTTKTTNTSSLLSKLHGPCIHGLAHPPCLSFPICRLELPHMPGLTLMRAECSHGVGSGGRDASKEGAGDSLPLLTPSSDLQNSRLPKTQRRSFEATFFTSTSKNRRPRVRQPLPIPRWTTCPWNPTGKLQPWGTSPGSPIRTSDRARGKVCPHPMGCPSALSPVPSADFWLSD